MIAVRNLRYPHHPSSQGFTLLELTVVVLLLSVLMGFAIPAIRGGTFLETHAGTARKIAWAVKRLKSNAFINQEVQTLHLDLDAGSIWTAQGNIPQPDKETRRADQWELPGGTRIDSILFPDQREIRSGLVEIKFYPQGYSDWAVIRLTDRDDEPTEILIEKFLPFARVLEEDGTASFYRRR